MQASQQTRRIAAHGQRIAASFAALVFLFIASFGFISVDEPRYAEMGRHMWRSGDWVTPLLWGEKFLEKPPLPFWATAVGHLAGLRDEWAARLPVLVASVGFLLLFHRRLRTEFDAETASVATAILALSPGWFVYSRLAVFDIPLAATFGAAMLFAMPWALRQDRRGLLWFGVSMGLAILTKALVPVALALPLLWLGRRRLRDLLLPAAIALAIAAPWYVLCYQRNGKMFLDELFIRHHFARFFSASTEVLHPQPVWFYIPVLLAGLWGWAPALLLALRQGVLAHPGTRYMAIWVGFGLAFFSASAGKLPGYVLPLLPPLAVLAGRALVVAKFRRPYLAAAAAMAVLLGPISLVAEDAAVVGLGKAWAALLQHQQQSAAASLPAPAILAAGGIVAAALAAFLVRSFGTVALLTLLLLLVSTNVVLQSPALSARQYRAGVLAHAQDSCYEQIHRRWEYGLNYYAGFAIPSCEAVPKRYHLRSEGPSHSLQVIDTAQ